MKKITIILALLSTITLVACKSETPIETPVDTDQVIPETTTTTIEGSTFTIPTEYTPLTKIPEDMLVFGTFAAYEFTNPKTLPSLIPQSIYFSSTESIEKGEAECKKLEGEAEWPCMHSPNVEEYKYQKQVLMEGKDYNKDTLLQKFNGRNYLVSNYDCSGDSCTMRTYSTFIGDTKIEIVIAMWGDETGDPTKDIAAADKILTKFSIE